MSVLGCQPTPPPPKVSDEAEALLRIVENTRLQLKERGDAAAELWRYPEAGVIDRLGRLLPGDDDVVTLEILGALGKMGDPRALPALERVRGQLDGKTNAALKWAIRKCQPK
jgi:hypothetical protein